LTTPPFRQNTTYRIESIKFIALVRCEQLNVHRKGNPTRTAAEFLGMELFSWLAGSAVERPGPGRHFTSDEHGFPL
jgi:hypothetical protein